MHIIVVSDTAAAARSITITKRHLLAALTAFVGLVLTVSTLFSLLALQHLPEIRLPFVQDLILSLRAEESQKTQVFVRENINAMAVKLGEMQAQVMYLGTVGDRLAHMTGIKSSEIKGSAKPGQGGPMSAGARSLTAAELQQQMDALSRQVEAKGDQLSIVENELLDERVRRNLLPTALPVHGAWDSSSFGRRIDPFSGRLSNHTGVDFSAEKGTPIYAAAGGVVIYAQFHPEYGNMVDIDHGDDLSTRYAHASKLLVAPGQLVKRGQLIAEVGSTGRSTGSHLHFEVRVKEVPKNPNRFLQMARDNALNTATR